MNEIGPEATPSKGFQLHPESASTFAPDVDAVYWWLTGVSLFFTFLICFLIIAFAVRYRRGAKVDRRYKWQQFWILETAWILVPFVIVMITFVWGARIFFHQFRPPEGTLDVYVVGKQWMWKIQHEEGRREVNTLHVPLGTPVRVHMISEDVIHSFYIPAFRTKRDVLPGRYTVQWFEPTKVGYYHLFCAEYCGTSHHAMRGTVIVQTPEDYAEWVAERDVDRASVSGQRIVDKYKCFDCHNPQFNRAPSFAGLFNSRVPLAGGGTVVADRDYIRESILNPNAKVVAGYTPMMPTFKGRISEEDIQQIIAYIESLAQVEPGSETGPGGPQESAAGGAESARAEQDPEAREQE